MDTSGFCQVGRYGTLSLLKRHNLQSQIPQTPSRKSDTDSVITSFGIDDEELTFGSSTNCGVRLYYQDVDAFHCKIMFEEFKAFLAVMGATGVLVDGCHVYPNTSSTDEEQQPTIVPLNNNSEFEIHGKRFKFAYPPKDMRKALYAVPARPTQSTLRLSMIHSAQVFSPRPSADARENLRVLQSPIKNPSPLKAKPRVSSPLKAGTIRLEDSDSDSDEEHAEGEEEIVLVHTNNPRVVEEEKDLVILEDVPFELLPSSPSKDGRARSSSPVKSANGFPFAPPPQEQPPPQTPRRRSLGGNALHRAVLIRSAQRAFVQREIEEQEALEEEEEREEEMEVLAGLEGDSSVEEEGPRAVDEMNPIPENEDEEMDQDTDTEEEDDEVEQRMNQARKSLWRKSIENMGKILPWSRGADTVEEADAQGNADADVSMESAQTESTEGNTSISTNASHSSVENDENEEPPSENVLPPPVTEAPAEPAHQVAPVRRALGSFMTPGPAPVRRNLFPNAAPSQTAAQPEVQPQGPGRYSLGAGGLEARRVLVREPWRVRDLVVPPPQSQSPATNTLNDASHHRLNTPQRLGPEDPSEGGNTPGRSRQTPQISVEERKQIQERRKSAVSEVRGLGGGSGWVPGMSPAKGILGASPAKGTDSHNGLLGSARRSRSVSPVKKLAFGAPGGTLGSPTKGRPLAPFIEEENSRMEEDDENEDAPNSKSAYMHHPGSNRSVYASATKDRDREPETDDDSMDTRDLLERMKETVEGMKRRRSSVLGGIGATPLVSAQTQGGPGSVLGSTIMNVKEATPLVSRMSLGLSAASRAVEEQLEVDVPLEQPFGGQIKKLDFTKIATPARSRSKSPLPPSKQPTQLQKETSPERDTQVQGEDEEKRPDAEPFSLLRPGLLERRQTLSGGSTPSPSTQIEDEPVGNTTVAVELPAVVVHDMDVDVDVKEPSEEKQVKPKTPRNKAKARQLEEQAPNDVDMQDAQETEAQKETAKPPSKTRSTRARSTTPLETAPTGRTTRQRSKTPQPPVVEAEEESEESNADAGHTKRGSGSSKPSSRTKPPSKSTAETTTKPPSRSRAGSASSSKGKAKVQANVPEEVDEEGDELDSYGEPGGDSDKQDGEEEDDDDDDDLPKPPPSRSGPTAAAATKAKGRSTTKMKTPTAATTTAKKRAVTVKKEQEEEDVAPAKTKAAGTASRATKGAKVNATPGAAGSSKSIPATTTRATKSASKVTTGTTTTTTKATRSRPKTPSTAPAATTAEKENTDKTVETSEEGVTKIRVSRTRVGTSASGASGARTSAAKAATAASGRKTPTATAAAGNGAIAQKVAGQEEEEESAPARTRATRAMRTRVKTG